MKTKLILALAGIAISSYIHAQNMFVPGGTGGIGNNTTNQFIGIGTLASAPLARLHVVGGFALFSSNAAPTTAALIRGNNSLSGPTNPDYTWYGTGNDQTGIYHPLANKIGFCTGGVEKMTIGNDNIIFGIPTTNSTANIGQCQNLDYGMAFLGFNVVHNVSNNTWVTQDGGSGTNGGSLIWGSVNGQISFSAIPNVGTGSQTPGDAQVLGYRVMRMKWNTTTGGPQVMIGNTMAAAHTDATLSVAGKVVAKEIYVTNTSWADYVFEENYQLLSLDSLENYITINNHLPNVPTTDEILTNGNNAGETDRILLEKVEELTLYILQLEKRIKELEQKN